MTGETICAAARAYLGVPWRHLGRSATGLDCIGLVLLAARDAGRALPDPPPYAREPQDTRLLEGILVHARRVSAAEPRDVLLFRMGLYGGHVGIASLHPAWRVHACIHAYAPHRCVVEQPMEGQLAAALIGAFRPKDNVRFPYNVWRLSGRRPEAPLKLLPFYVWHEMCLFIKS